MSSPARLSLAAPLCLLLLACGGGDSKGDDEAAAGAGASEPEGVSTLFFLNADTSQGRVLSIEPGAGSPTVIADSGAGDMVDGVAVDAEGGWVYWTNMGMFGTASVHRARLDGSEVELLATEPELDTPKQIQIDRANGKLYYTDREGMRVHRSNLDGSDFEVLVTVATGDAARADASNHCVGIAVDAEAGYFYWTQKGPANGGQGRILRAGIEMPAGKDSTDRDDIEVLFEGLPEPIDLSLDVGAGHLYWTDRGDDTVNRAPVDLPSGATAADRSDREILVEGVPEAIGISLDLARGWIYFSELGGELESNPLSLLTGTTNGRVRRARLDGSEDELVIDGVGALTGVEHADLPE